MNNKILVTEVVVFGEEQNNLSAKNQILLQIKSTISF